MPEASPVTVKELRAWRRELAALGKEWPKEQAKVSRTVAKKGAGYAQSRARMLGGIHAKAAGAIKGKGSATTARISVAPGARTPMGNPAFWGAKRFTGWHRGQTGRPNLPPWVGNSWEVAVAGSGPYAINDALAAYLPELLEDYRRGLDELTARAFPN